MFLVQNFTNLYKRNEHFPFKLGFNSVTKLLLPIYYLYVVALVHDEHFKVKLKSEFKRNVFLLYIYMTESFTK